MLREKTTDKMILFTYIFVILVHIIYGLVNFPISQHLYIVTASSISTIPIIATKLIPHGKYKWLTCYGIQIIDMIILAFIDAYLLNLSAYTPIIYFLICIEYTAYSDLRINVLLDILCNAGVIITYIFCSDIINNTLGVQYYIMTCGYLEIIIIFDFFIAASSIKQQKELDSHTKSLVEAQKTKDTFLANMSHELRTPLNVIIGMDELLLREKNLSNTIIEYGNNMHNAAQNLLSIVNDLLDFSKIGSGKMTLIEDSYHISNLVTDIVNLAFTRNADKHLELIIDCNPNIPETLYGDEQRIRQVFTNLVTNAIKYTPSGAVYIYIDRRPTIYGINLNISVQDTGIGIKDQNLGTIFESFSQVDMKKNRKIEGTGLGLPISKKLVTAMGGFLHVKSEYGVGSEFFATIPQKIIDEKPFLSIQSDKKTRILICTNYRALHNERIRQFYENFVVNISRELSIPYDICEDIKQIDEFLRKNTYTHIAVGSLYKSYTALFLNLSKKYKILLTSTSTKNSYSIPNIIPIDKPLTTIAFVNAINGKTTLRVESRKSNIDNSIYIPDAKVLIVDDNAINRKIIEGLLKPYCIQCDKASSGAKALQLIDTRQYDIIFMDHMMPDMDGVETTRRIRLKNNGAAKDIPVIAFSANAFNGIKEEFIAKGFQDFISKPIEIPALERILKTWLPKEYFKKRTTPLAQNSTNNCITANVRSKSENLKLLPDMSYYKDYLKQQGINLDDALEYCNESIEQYLQILLIFYNDIPAQIQKLDLYSKQENWKNYQITAHSIKASARTLGASQLYSMAYEHEMAAKSEDGAYIISHIRELRFESEHICDIFSTVIRSMS